VEDLERIKDRLDNIQGVEPIITSLRTIAAGGWRLALRRIEATTWYLENLSDVLGSLVPLVTPEDLEGARIVRNAAPRRPLMLVMASERGLCGAFNDTVIQGAERLIAQQQVRSDQVLLGTLGSRATAYYRSRGRPLVLSRELPVTRVASIDLVRSLAEEMLELVDAGEIDGVYTIYSPYRVGTTAEPISRLWMPIDATALPSASEAWPPPVIESDVKLLFERTIEEWTLASLFHAVMESAASEQSARFRAMDNASGNLTRLIEELTLSYHTARQHAITMEMLDLVAGSGILRTPRGHEGTEGR